MPLPSFDEQTRLCERAAVAAAVEKPAREMSGHHNPVIAVLKSREFRGYGAQKTSLYVNPI